MKKTILALALTLFAAPAVATEMPKDLRQLNDQVAQPTVRINDNCSGQIIWSNRDQKSGEVKTLILTAGHCVEDGDKKLYTIDFPVYDKANRLVKEETYFARYVGKSYKADVALLVLKDKDTYFDKVAKLAPKDVQVFRGEDVIVAGYPKAQDITLTRGMLGQIVEDDGFGFGHLEEYYGSSPLTTGGNSGGGLYHKNAGNDWELIGTVTGGYRDAPWMNYFTTIERINEYLTTAAPEMFGKKEDTKAGGPK